MPFTPIGDDRFSVHLPGEARALLRSLAEDLVPRVRGRERETWRLFPPGHADDAAREAGYRELIGESLRDSHLAALAVVIDGTDADELSREDLEAWMRAVGSIRLVVGPAPENPSDEDGWRHEVTAGFLGALQQAAIEALDPEFRELR